MGLSSSFSYDEQHDALVVAANWIDLKSKSLCAFAIVATADAKVKFRHAILTTPCHTVADDVDTGSDDALRADGNDTGRCCRASLTLDTATFWLKHR